MRVALYGRVSTADKEQNLDTQLIPLRAFAEAQGWTEVREYTDQASATDLLHRESWRQLLDAASKRKVDLIVVWRLDRAFRSVLDAANTLERLRGWGAGLRSYQEPWLDTTSPFGEALYYITVAYAQLERGILAERVRAGMDRAKREGVRIGRPPVTDSAKVGPRWPEVQRRIEAGELSRRAAAKTLGVSDSTIRRLLAGTEGGA